MRGCGAGGEHDEAAVPCVGARVDEGGKVAADEVQGRGTEADVAREVGGAELGLDGAWPYEQWCRHRATPLI